MDFFITPKAEKQINKLPKSEQKKINRKFVYIRDNPFSAKGLSGELEGFLCARAWPYRIIYHINKRRNEIWVDFVVHRQGVYK
jgi:mRNA-degrading endonuclease RelE of RelBE toxin-antitoxin system